MRNVIAHHEGYVENIIRDRSFWVCLTNDDNDMWRFLYDVASLPEDELPFLQEGAYVDLIVFNDSSVSLIFMKDSWTEEEINQADAEAKQLTKPFGVSDMSMYESNPEERLAELFYQIINMSREHEAMPDWALALKLGEETGEIHTAILKSKGYLKHKEESEDVLHEVADVFNVCTGILVKHYPDLSTDDLITALADAMEKKGDKYKKILNGEIGDVNDR